MSIGRRVLRLVLLLFVVGLGAAVLLGLRERAAPASALVVERSDPEALIQTRSSRIVQADSIGDNFNAVAGRQLTYPDGEVRMLDGVEVTVDARDDRRAFALQGAAATINGDQTEVNLTGDVRFATGDGLEARSEHVSYSSTDGIARMPGAASFRRDGLRASARQAVYDRNADRLRLWGDAAVALTTSEPPTEIAAAAALIAQRDGYMTFDGGVAIDADRLQMSAAEARAEVAGESSALEALALAGGARIQGRDRTPGRLRGMSASDIRIAYAEGGRHVEQATLAGNARLALFAAGGGRGTEIGARSMEVGFAPGGDGLGALEAREEVVLEMPRVAGGPARRVTADALRGESRSGGGLDHVEFDGSVEYRERVARGEAGAARTGRADRLETTFAAGLAALEVATFRGNVTFGDSEVQGSGDEARYVVADDLIELVQADPEGQLPRVVDQRGSVQAEEIRLAFDGPRIEARDIESVLHGAGEPGSAPGSGSGEAQRPRLLDGAELVLVTAGELLYEGAEQTATYGGGARLWQGDTQFRGRTIVLDEAVGDLRIDGDAWTQFAITQINDETGSPEALLSIGSGGAMRYENAERLVTWTTGAGLDGPRGDLKAETIQVHLGADDNTLDRMTAEGDVTLVSPGRRVSGETLDYDDAAGRYEMSGRPVRMVEEIDDSCRETIGRTLTFFVTEDDVSVDGLAESRTVTNSGPCPELMR